MYMEIKKPNTTNIILLGLFVASLIVWGWVQFAAVKDTRSEYRRCDMYSSHRVDHDKNACIAAGCQPKYGGEWQCVPL